MKFSSTKYTRKRLATVGQSLTIIMILNLVLFERYFGWEVIWWLAKVYTWAPAIYLVPLLSKWMTTFLELEPSFYTKLLGVLALLFNFY